jgi:hypothetical protein
MFKGPSTFVKSIIDGRKTRAFLRKRRTLVTKLKKFLGFLLEPCKNFLFVVSALLFIFVVGGFLWVLPGVLQLLFFIENPEDIINPLGKLRPVKEW